MKITMPYLGNTNLAAKALFDDLEIEYIMPEFSNTLALEKGTKYSPEDICLPYKIMLGNIIMAYEKGADTVLITGSCGPCRYGEYCELYKIAFEKLSMNIDLIVLDYPKDIGKKELYSRLRKIWDSSKAKKQDKLQAIVNALRVIRLIDYIEGRARYLSGYEVERGAFKKIITDCKTKAYKAEGGKKMLEILKYYKLKLEHTKVNMRKKPVSIALIGEIYTILEPFANLYIEDKLMELGISVRREMAPSWWVKDAILTPLKMNSIKLRLASRKYLPCYIGGHGRECVGEAVVAKAEGMDGAIQIFPLGCMPEIVAKAILPQISKEGSFPIMSLVVDELTGEAGFSTRIEAFVDLLEKRREKQCTM